MSTRERVLEALKASAPERSVSGEELARALGVSRAAVAKHIAALKAAGYDIESTHGIGYRLVYSPLIALPWEVASLVRDPLWARIEGGVETGSTNDDARTLARTGAAHGTVVVTGRQSAGKGRLGRQWESPQGGAYVSVVLRPDAAPVEVAPLGLVVAIGIARGLVEMGVAAQLKWPNDVWLDGRKLAGVLLEMSAEAETVTWVVAGFGINVARPDSDDTLGEPPGSTGERTSHPSVAYISDVNADVTPSEVAAAALDGVASAYRAWEGEGFAPLAAEFEKLSVLNGQDVTVRDSAGVTIATGVVEGIDVDGRLLLRDADEDLHRIAAGDVTLRA